MVEFPHEYRHLQEETEDKVISEFEFADNDDKDGNGASANVASSISKAASVSRHSATPAYNPASDFWLGEEPIENSLADAAMAPPPGSDIPKEVLFEDPKLQQDDDDPFVMSGSDGQLDEFGPTTDCAL